MNTFGIKQHIFLIIAIAFNMACQRSALTSCRGSSRSASVGAVSTSPMAGGFVTYTRDVVRLDGPLSSNSATAITTREQKRCTAVFDFTDSLSNGKKPFRIFTAAHCSGRTLDDVTALEIDVWGGDGYLHLPVSLNYAEQRKLAIQSMSQAGFSINDWIAAMSWPISLESDPTISPPCRPEFGSAADANGSAQDLCFSWTDLAVLDASMPDNLYIEYKAALPVTPVVATGSAQLASFFEGHKRLTHLRYELNAAQQVDAMYKCMNAGSTCSSSQVDALHEVLSKYVFVGGMNALSAAQREGVTNSSVSYESLKSNEYKTAVENMKEQWNVMPVEVLSLLTNTMSPNTSFGSQFLSALGAGLRFTKETYGLRILVPARSPTLTFSKGDSGSLVIASGRAPVLTLQSVNNEETSGGASLQTLPQRPNPKAPVTETTDSPVACN